MKIVFMAAAAVMVHSLAAQAMHCPRGIVAAGDSKFEVETKCGAPLSRNLQTEEESHPVSVKTIEKKTTEIETWSYNFGGVVTYFITFRNGYISETSNQGQGFTVGSGDSCRNGQLISVGDSVAELLMKCGEPVQREQRPEERVSRDKGSKQKVTFSIEEWTYNFGPDRLLYFVTVDNGTVTEVRTGGYGR